LLLFNKKHDQPQEAGNTVCPGWTEVASHASLRMNAAPWLAKQVSLTELAPA
jgi:hypothetical protein